MRAIEEFDGRFDSANSENSLVVRAIRMHGLATARQELETAETSVESEEQRLHDELSEIDREWASHRERCGPRLAQIAAELSFLQKWSGQIRERTLRFEELV